MGDAIGRTLFRLFISRRNLLEWVTAAQVKRKSRLRLDGIYRQMMSSVLIGIGAVIVAWRAGGDAWPVMAPVVALWIASPAIARWTSLPPIVGGRLSVSAEGAPPLKCIQSRNWRLFRVLIFEG